MIAAKFEIFIIFYYHLSRYDKDTKLIVLTLSYADNFYVDLVYTLENCLNLRCHAPLPQ